MSTIEVNNLLSQMRLMTGQVRAGQRAQGDVDRGAVGRWATGFLVLAQAVYFRGGAQSDGGRKHGGEF